MTGFAIHFHKAEVNVGMIVNVAFCDMNETTGFYFWQIPKLSLTFLYSLEK